MKDNISRVYAGPECSILFMESGNLYVCGSNSENRFGFGSTTKKIVAFVSNDFDYYINHFRTNDSIL